MKKQYKDKEGTQGQFLVPVAWMSVGHGSCPRVPEKGWVKGSIPRPTHFSKILFKGEAI